MRLDLPPSLILTDIMPLTAQLQASIARHALLGAYYMGARLFLSPHMHDAWHKTPPFGLRPSILLFRPSRDK